MLIINPTLVSIDLPQPLMIDTAAIRLGDMVLLYSKALAIVADTVMAGRVALVYSPFLIMDRYNFSPDANDLIPISAEAWWPSYGEGGNGDLDAKDTGGGYLYLDFVTDMYGMAWFVRLFTGVILRKRIHITHV